MSRAKTRELIQKLELLKAEIEWEHSIEHQILLDEVIEVLNDGQGEISDGQKA